MRWRRPAPGFIWRLKDDSGNATSIAAFPDPLLLVNLSVWTDIASLQDYVYRSVHGKYFARRAAWFEKPERPHLALWWIPAGHIPTVDEAKIRLARLEAAGPSADAFTFRSAFPPPAGSAAIGPA
ncbi:MAG TPA: DUF3291 domain-containing protein [Opitutus sp.]|nr:DUF3291 domain-containing protein [Opitutus sp.]